MNTAVVFLLSLEETSFAIIVKLSNGAVNSQRCESFYVCSITPCVNCKISIFLLPQETFKNKNNVHHLGLHKIAFTLLWSLNSIVALDLLQINWLVFIWDAAMGSGRLNYLVGLSSNASQYSELTDGENRGGSLDTSELRY